MINKNYFYHKVAQRIFTKDTKIKPSCSLVMNLVTFMVPNIYKKTRFALRGLKSWWTF